MVQEDAGQGHYWTDSAGLQGYLQAGKYFVTTIVPIVYVQFVMKKLIFVPLFETTNFV